MSLLRLALGPASPRILGLIEQAQPLHGERCLFLNISCQVCCLLQSHTLGVVF